MAAYEPFFGLREKPFRISPDPRFLYLAPQHREVLSKCQYMVSNKVGPVYELVNGRLLRARGLVLAIR